MWWHATYCFSHASRHPPPRRSPAALAARDYATLTPVQAAVIEPDAAGRDLIVSARTGSGKTVAFGLNMATELLADARCPHPPRRWRW